MIYIAITALAVSAASVAAFASALRSLVRQQARERGVLLNQIMHLSGKTWSPPPAADREPRETAPRETLANPEHLPEWEFAE